MSDIIERLKSGDASWELREKAVKEIERLTVLVASCSARNESDADLIEGLKAELNG